MNLFFASGGGIGSCTGVKGHISLRPHIKNFKNLIEDLDWTWQIKKIIIIIFLYLYNKHCKIHVFFKNCSFLSIKNKIWLKLHFKYCYHQNKKKMVLNMSYLIFGGDSVSLNQILKIPNLKFFYSVYGIVMTFDPPCTTLYPCLIHNQSPIGKRWSSVPLPCSIIL